MTLSLCDYGFQGHGTFQRRISQKRCILETKLLYGADRKPKVGYRTVAV